MKKGEKPAKEAWNHSTQKTFQASTLGKLIKKPSTPAVKALEEKTKALKLMSLDFASSGVARK
jgi:hypothetical protein